MWECERLQRKPCQWAKRMPLQRVRELFWQQTIWLYLWRCRYLLWQIQSKFGVRDRGQQLFGMAADRRQDKRQVKAGRKGTVENINRANLKPYCHKFEKKHKYNYICSEMDSKMTYENKDLIPRFDRWPESSLERRGVLILNFCYGQKTNKAKSI